MTTETTCPNCGSTDIKNDVAINDGEDYDHGCRDCRIVFDAPALEDEDEMHVQE